MFSHSRQTSRGCYNFLMLINTIQAAILIQIGISLRILKKTSNAYHQQEQAISEEG